MFRLGVSRPNERDYTSLHSGKFDFNDGAVKPGILMMCGLAIERISYLRSEFWCQVSTPII